jgi:hypothetical protein
VTSEATLTDPENSDTPRRASGKHRLVKVLLGVVIMLAVGEIATRAIASDLPAPGQWSNYEIQRKVGQLDALSAKGGAQVVFFGSSLVDLGVDPTVVDQQIGGGVESYDAGLLGSSPTESAAWAEHVVIPKLHPRVIVLGVDSFDLEDVKEMTDYDAFIQSAGYKQITDTQDPIQNVNQWIGKYSSLWYNKDSLRDPETVLRALAGRPQPVNEYAADLSADGRQTENQYSHWVNYAGVYVGNWTLGKRNPAAIVQLVSYARARHISVVLVDMPVTTQFVATMPGGNYQPYLDALGAIGSRTGAGVLYDHRISNVEFFQDDIHMNLRGAEYFSAVLGSQLKPLFK